LSLLAKWISEENTEKENYNLLNEYAQKAYESFNKSFWFEKGGYLYDVIDGENAEDSSCRPNQIFAISLKHPILKEDLWRPVLNVAKERLLTPVGLRSLSPGDPDYKSKYFGDLRTRDAAYHQGTVWPWLIGPFIDAWKKTYPDDKESIKDFLKGFKDHLNEACIGSISEVFDAEAPFTARGCISQAWSVAEILRCLIKQSNILKAMQEKSQTKTVPNS